MPISMNEGNEMNNKVYKSSITNLILISIAKFLSGFASYIYDVGIAIYLFDETQSVAVMSGFFISQLLPVFLILLSGGVIDRYNKKNLMVLANLAKAVLFLLLLCDKSIWCIYIVTFLMNLILEFESNTFSALMTNAFSKEELLKVASIVNLLDSASMLIAPVSASLIAMHFTININLLLDILLFAGTMGIYLLLRIKPLPIVEKREEKRIGREYGQIIRDRTMRKTVIFWGIFMFCIGVTTPLEISMIENTLGMSSAYYGIGNTVEGLGMLAASVFILGIIRKLRSEYIIGLGLFSSALSYFVIGSAGNIWVYFVGACFVGITATFCPLGFKTEIQTKSNPAFIGRTFTGARFFVLLTRIGGSFVVGQVSKVWDIRIIYYVIAGILLLAAGFYAKSLDRKIGL